MKSLKKFLNLQFKKIPNPIIIAFAAVSFIGFLDAAYLTAKHYVGFPLPCSFFTGCEAVTTSQYAVFIGIPIALIGALYYLAILVFALFYLDTKQKLALIPLGLLPIAGFLISGALIFIQVFIIHAICIYCVTSAVSSTILAGLSFYILNFYTIKNKAIN